MTKIFFITGSMPPIKCGISFYSTKLICELDKIDVKTSIITSLGVEDKDNIILKTDWRITDLPKILKVIKVSGLDVIHIQYPAVGYGRRLGINLLPWIIRVRFPSKKIIFTLHEYHASKAIRILGKIRNIITVFPAHKVVVSNNIDLHRLRKFLERRVVVIPIGSNMEIPNPSVKNRASNEIVYFGYPHQSKNLETLIGAMDLLPTYKLRFFSRFNKNDSYAMSLIDKMKSVNNIVIETDASDENIVTALAKSAFFVLPQDQPLTAKSSTAITAACCGSVVIAKASDNPKYQMPYINNVNCLLMEDVLPTSIANAIKNTSPKQVLELSNESLKLRSYFDWDNIVRSYGKLYK